MHDQAICNRKMFVNVVCQQDHVVKSRCKLMIFKTQKQKMWCLRRILPLCRISISVILESTLELRTS